MLERYGGAIEYDLQAVLHLDLLEFFRHRYTWRKLVTLLDHLPKGSAYWAARADDDELARAVLRRNDTPTGRGPLGLEDMTPTNQLLLDMTNRLALIYHGIRVLAKDRTARPPVPLQAPETAIARQRARSEVNAYEDLVAEAKAAQARAADQEDPGTVG